MKNILIIPILCIGFLSCHTSKELALERSLSKLELVGSIDLPHNLLYQNTTVGGLSGIDYDAVKDEYYLICDDRSALNPARYYTARLFFTPGSVDSVHFTGVQYLKRLDGSYFPSSAQDPRHTPDPEALRLIPRSQDIVWSSEGERIVRGRITILEDPAIYIAGRDGRLRDSFQLPENMHMHSDEKGPRQNGVFEGMSYLPNGDLLVSVEEPVYEDGPRAGLGDSSAWIRFIRFDGSTHQPKAEYGYRIDPVAHAPLPAQAFRINGVPDILALNQSQLLVLERSFSTGISGCTIRIYLANLHGAENIMNRPALADHNFQYVTKKLLVNMDSLGIYIDNVEGMTLGPRLPDGRQTLIMVADNNFSSEEKTQFFVWAF